MSHQTKHQPTFENILLDYFEATPELDIAPKIARITLNRPQVLNAINTQTSQEMLVAMKMLRDDEQVRVVYITGAGRAFCTGADLKERLNMTDEAWLAQRHVFQESFEVTYNFPKPFFAAVNGMAFGGGTEMALGCDFIVASTAASFALTEVSRGIMPGAGGTQYLLRLVGQNFARWMVFSGAKVEAAEAYRVGLVQHLIEGDPQTFEAETLKLARQIAVNSPLAVRQVKQAVREGLEVGLREGFEAENRAYAICIPSQDRREGMLAFNEKRPPHFTGH